MTPCEKLGYKVGDRFEIVMPHMYFTIGSIVTLSHDDGSKCPLFKRGGDRFYIDLFKCVKVIDNSTKEKVVSVNSLEQNIERMQKELDEMKAKLEAEKESSKKPVDLSVLIRSGIDCEFGEVMTEAPATVVGALESIYPDVSRSYKKLNGGWWSYCTPRMTYWHPWRGGDCPLPDGLEIEVEFRSGAAATTTAPSDLQWDHIKSGGDIIAFRVIGLEEGYCWPWEI